MNRHQLEHYCPPPPQPWAPVYEDEHLLAVNKPSGLLTVPGRGEHVQDCLIHRVQLHCPQALIVHRLDMDTSGLVLLAKGSEMQRELSQLFMRREVDKRYEALVCGRPEQDEGEVNLPLITDWPNRPRQKVDLASGKPALTRYRVVPERSLPDQARWWLDLMPHTGRSHQLRVHCLALGCPIVGDRLYGPPPQDTGGLDSRLMLHAVALAFDHPRSHARLCLSVPRAF